MYKQNGTHAIFETSSPVQHKDRKEAGKAEEKMEGYSVITAQAETCFR